AETIDQDPPTLARGGHETVRCCECGIEEDQAATARLPERTARGPFGARDAARTPSCGGNGLELDVSVPVLQERDRFPIGGRRAPRALRSRGARPRRRRRCSFHPAAMRSLSRYRPRS